MGVGYLRGFKGGFSCIEEAQIFCRYPVFELGTSGVILRGSPLLVVAISVYANYKRGRDNINEADKFFFKVFNLGWGEI